MTPLDQHVGVDVMINPPSLVNFHDGKITDNTQDMAARNSDVFLYISYSKRKLKKLTKPNAPQLLIWRGEAPGLMGLDLTCLDRPKTKPKLTIIKNSKLILTF